MQNDTEFVKVWMNESKVGLVSVNIKRLKDFKYESCMFCMNDANAWFNTRIEACDAHGDFRVCSLSKYMNCFESLFMSILKFHLSKTSLT